MKTGASLKNRQGGAVAVMVGISMVVLVGFLALVLDLGHLYIAKTELQNAADAAALAGAKELDGKATGIANGVNRAITTAAQNNYDFSRPVDIAIANISVGSCPSDACMVPASTVTTDTAAADKTFLKVHTSPPDRTLTTWFAPIFNLVTGGSYGTTRTFGMAVAGRYLVDITPIGICELPNDHANAYDNELGYERGVSYKVSDANPLGPGTPFWIDPTTAAATGPSDCDGSVPASLPYICVGKTAFTPIVGGYVYTNTGISTPQLAALDSRFDEYAPQGKCDYTTAPPDSNIKEYRYTDSAAGSPSRWMEDPYPTRQSILFVDALTGGICLPGMACRPKLLAIREFKDYGVLWSASRRPGATADQWPSIYRGAATGYPEPSPYAQTNGDFHQPPKLIHPARPGRRMIHMVIVECATAGGTCRPAKVKGVGRFFLQRKANIPGDKEIYGEFAGLLPTPFSLAEIRLYR